LHYIDIAIFVLGYFILPHPVFGTDGQKTARTENGTKDATDSTKT